MCKDPLADYGLSPVELADRATMERYFSSLKEPLSDYTFSQLYTWRNSLRIAWRVLEDHLCVFANGSGDLTMLIPPIGDTGADRALRRSIEIMDDYNRAHDCLDHSRIEYVSQELLSRLGAHVEAAPQGTDYLYDVARMIDLSGGDLASKRQAKNRFMRNYRYRVESYQRELHLEPCRQLLHQWKGRQDQAHAADLCASAIKRTKESLATELTLEQAGELGLDGLVVWVEDADGAWRVKGFTFGEKLGSDQASIVVEKTDLECRGLAQFIFSEFCARSWANRPLINAGDDWGLESLAWTKKSYRPVKLLAKYALRPASATAVAIAGSIAAPDAVMPAAALDLKPLPLHPRRMDHSQDPPAITLRRAQIEDLAVVEELERACFEHYTLTRRQLRYLQRCPTATFLVAEVDGHLAGDAIGLIRHHRGSVSGRIYSLAVDGRHRGAGIGRTLLEALIRQLREQGAGRIYLEVEQGNAPAVRLYERLGFTVAGTLTDYYGAGAHGVHMVHQAKVTQAA